MAHRDPTKALPQAVLKDERRLSWIWLIPAAALLLACWIGFRAWTMRGLDITVLFTEGHGLQAGADIRSSGIAVGHVKKVELTDDLSGVQVIATLFPHAARLARAGSRFWIVRPRLDVSGVAGLETVVGPRYLAMIPGDGPPRRQFLGLQEPPVVDLIAPGDLEIVLQTPRRGGLRPGAPVLYRQVPIGTVLSVGLSSDGGAVEARVHIQKSYTELIRERTRFWNASGLEAQLGLRGVSIEVDTLESLLAGGVALATPPDAGEVVRNGHRFLLEEKPVADALNWQPLVAIGNPLLPPRTVLPDPVRAVLENRHWLGNRSTDRGWVLQLEEGLLGPEDLLQPNQSDDPPTIEIAGREVQLPQKTKWSHNGLVLLELRLARPYRWNGGRRRPTQPEDCLAIGDRASAPLPLASARLQRGENGCWSIDPAVSLDRSWHGAAVLSRTDGQLIGMILVDDKQARVALLPDG